jgi:benzoate membrane transport protein
MMAGILFRFGAGALGGLETAPVTVAAMLLAFVVLSAVTPRYALIWLLMLTLGLTFASGDAGDGGGAGLILAQPHLVWPAFTLQAFLGLAIPLALTTLTGQFLAGLTILRANGFTVAARPVLVLASLVSLPAALFGGITTALASITMALGAGPEAHPDRSRRYVAGVASGAFFLLTAVFAGFVGGVMVRLPVELIALLAGLALLGAIARGLSDMLDSGEDLQAGMLTFVTSASGIVVLGINAAFWGILVGIVAVQVTRLVRRLQGPRPA